MDLAVVARSPWSRDVALPVDITPLASHPHSVSTRVLGKGFFFCPNQLPLLHLAAPNTLPCVPRCPLTRSGDPRSGWPNWGAQPRAAPSQ